MNYYFITGSSYFLKSFTANMAFLSLVAADNMLNSATYRQFASSQIDYMLGDGGRSYVVGFGTNPPHSPHHRSRYDVILTLSI